MRQEKTKLIICIYPSIKNLGNALNS